jgi:Tfp pilus assembly protein PilF
MIGQPPQDLQELLEEALERADKGEPAAAEALLRQVLTRAPGHALAWDRLGSAQRAQSRPKEAELAHRKAVELAPQSSDAHNNLGAALKQQGRTAEAVDCFRQALTLDARHFQAQFNLGAALAGLNRIDDAATALERALSLRPDFTPAHQMFAFLSLWRGRLDEAAAWFRGAAALTQDHGRPERRAAVAKCRVRHDAHQTRYLLERGLLGPGLAPYAEALERLARRAERDDGTSWRMAVSPAELAAIEPAYNRLLHVADCPRLGAVINPGLDVPAIEARYHAQRPELMHVDGLLTGEALRALRRFCLESTIWKRDYPGGYLGAFAGDGFACPLLLQIAEELRLRFPAIFGQHRLHQAWAFKYDSVSQGLKIHADTAAVNVNFWITPDDANLDPEHGGLVVWDKEPPGDWDFNEYNNESKEPAVLEFLESEGARAVTVPYRENRAVIFNSNLFHCTDSFNFQDEYGSRRVNVTLLYGDRQGRDPRPAAEH